jgi:type I restriction enzyme, S subunit
MKKWKHQPIYSVGTVVTGSTPRTSEDSFYGGEIPFITPAELDQNDPVITATRTLSESGGKEARLLPEGAVMVCCIGSLGKIGIAGRTVVTNQQINSVVFDVEKILPRFGFHACRLLKSQLITMAPATTVAIVSKSKFEKLEIPVPPLEEQKRIAEILDRTQSLISKRKEAIAKLDTLTQSIFLEMFGDPVTNSFKLPFLPLENVVSESFQNGAYFPKEAYCIEGGVEMIHMSDAFEGIVKRGNLKRVDCSKQDIQRYKISDRDLIVARRSLNYKGSVKPCLIPLSTEPLIFESSLIRITPNPEKAIVIYLFYYILNPRVRERFIFPFVTKSTISGINQGNLAKVLVMIPPINLQKEFAQRVEAVEKLKATHRASLSQLQALFASLQHRAFRGEL